MRFCCYARPDELGCRRLLIGRRSSGKILILSRKEPDTMLPKVSVAFFSSL